MTKDTMKVMNPDEYFNEEGITALIYAQPKTGKTTMFKSLPGKTLVIDTGDRGAVVLRGSKDVQIIKAYNFEELHKVANWLQKSCPFDNVCIDTITEIRKREVALRSTEEVDGKLVIKDLGFKGWGEIANKLSKTLRSFYELSADGTNVIFTAHETVFEQEDATGNKTSVIIPDVGDSKGKASNEFSGMVDMVGRLKIKPDTGERYVQFLSKEMSNICGDRIFDREFCMADELLNPKQKTENKTTTQGDK